MEICVFLSKLHAISAIGIKCLSQLGTFAAKISIATMIFAFAVAYEVSQDFGEESARLQLIG